MITLILSGLSIFVKGFHVFFIGCLFLFGSLAGGFLLSE